MAKLKRAIVTGGAGFLGSHLCERLLDDQYEVLCLDNFLTGSAENLRGCLSHPRFHLAEMDVAESIAVQGPVSAVLHLASPASPHDYAAHPIETLLAGSAGTQNALRLAQDCGARFLLASTSEVYGEPLTHPQHESYWGNVNPIGPRSVYDEAKRFAESMTAAYRRRHSVNTTIARFFNTYGPRMRPFDGRAIPTFIRQALMDEALTVAGDGKQTRSACYVDDLIEGVIALLHADEPGPVNLGNPHEITVLELAETIIRMTGSRSAIRYVPRPEDDPSRRRPDISTAYRVLGWKPMTSLADGLKRTIEWSRDVYQPPSDRQLEGKSA